MVLWFVLAGLLGYFLGSIPAAYLAVRWKSNIDIRNAGSGNVGTLNSFEVTRSKAVGAVVLIFDLLKGMLAIFLAHALFGSDFVFGAIAGLCAVVGHNFPIWLHFKGGRGLATAAGVVLIFGWLLVAGWGLLWGIGFLIWRKVNMGNAFATVCLLIAMVMIPDGTISFVINEGIPVGEFRMFGALLMAVILIRHIEPLREYYATKNVSKETLHQG